MPPKKDSPKKDSPKKDSPRKGSPEKNAKGKKGSPTRGKKGDGGEAVDYDKDEDEVIVPVPQGVLTHRLKFMLQNQLKSDVEFLLGEKDKNVSVKAHKCILASESPIFEKLFADMEAGNYEKEDKDADKAEEGAEGKKDSPKKGDKGKKESPKKDKKKDSPRKDPSPAKGEKKDSPPKGKGKSPDGSKKNSPKKGTKKGAGGDEANEEATDAHKDKILNDKQILIPDIHPEGFYKMLRYIYHDEVVFDSVIGALRALYAARKYGITILANYLVEYLENNVSVEVVLTLLKASLDLHLDRLKYNCMNLLINETFQVVNREEFCHTEHRIIELILQQDILNIREIELFDQVMHWAENECEKAKVTVNAVNQRAMLRLAFDLIRFPTILPHEFAIHVVPSGALRSDEIIPILSYYVTGREPSMLPYSCKTRRRPCLRLDKYETDSVAFTDDTDLTFVGYDARRPNSCRDIWIPVGNHPPFKDKGILTRRYRTTSIPNAFDVDKDTFEDIVINLTALKDIDDDRLMFEYCKKHMLLLRRHYK